jgi:hypothetical protein
MRSAPTEHLDFYFFSQFGASIDFLPAGCLFLLCVLHIVILPLRKSQTQFLDESHTRISFESYALTLCDHYKHFKYC